MGVRPDDISKAARSEEERFRARKMRGMYGHRRPDGTIERPGPDGLFENERDAGETLDSLGLRLVTD